MSWGLRPESERHRDEREERERVKREVRARDRLCQARHLDPKAITSEAARKAWPVRCEGPLDVHERIPRSAWRAGYLVVDNCLLICRGHHDWIDDWPDEAHELGLHGYSWERPDA